MPSISLSLSADAANSAIVGGDYNMWTPPRCIQGWTVANEQGPGNTLNYFMPGNGASPVNTTFYAGQGYVWPVLFTRDTRITNLVQYVGTGAGGSNQVNYSLYATSADGWPGPKIADWGSGSIASSSLLSYASPLTGMGSLVWKANVLYWMLMWSPGTASWSMFARSTPWTGNVRVNTSTAPVAANFTATTVYTGAYIETNMGYTARAAGPPTLMNSTSNASLPVSVQPAPVLCYALTNI